MSNYVLPDLPLLMPDIDRESIQKTNVFENPGGTEQRVSFYSAPRYRWRLKYDALRTDVQAPSPWQAYTELGVLLYFHDYHHGPWDSFLFVDPWDATQKRVRFEEDTFTVRRIVPGLYDVSFSLISVPA